MSDQEGQEQRAGAGDEGPREGAPIVHAVRRTSRFSREVLATMISLASAAFGVVAALAWNTAITKIFEGFTGETAERTALFIYAVVVTLVGVIVIVILGRIAARIQAQPVEFRYPAIPPRS